MQFGACEFALGRAPGAPLGVTEPKSQGTAPAAAYWLPPLRSADHPATPWWSALLRGGRRGEAREEEMSESRAVGGADEKEKRSDEDRRCVVVCGRRRMEDGSVGQDEEARRANGRTHHRA